jgi:hypothetical protein
VTTGGARVTNVPVKYETIDPCALHSFDRQGEREVVMVWDVYVTDHSNQGPVREGFFGKAEDHRAPLIHRRLRPAAKRASMSPQYGGGNMKE